MKDCKIIAELKIKMTQDAQFIMRMIQINPEVSSEELVANGYGQSVHEVDFIREQLKMNGYI